MSGVLDHGQQSLASPLLTHTQTFVSHWFVLFAKNTLGGWEESFIIHLTFLFYPWSVNLVKLKLIPRAFRISHFLAATEWLCVCMESWVVSS